MGIAEKQIYKHRKTGDLHGVLALGKNIEEAVDSIYHYDTSSAIADRIVYCSSIEDFKRDFAFSPIKLTISEDKESVPLSKEISELMVPIKEETKKTLTSIMWDRARNFNQNAVFVTLTSKDDTSASLDTPVVNIGSTHASKIVEWLSLGGFKVTSANFDNRIIYLPETTSIRISWI